MLLIEVIVCCCCCERSGDELMATKYVGVLGKASLAALIMCAALCRVDQSGADLSLIPTDMMTANGSGGMGLVLSWAKVCKMWVILCMRAPGYDSSCVLCFGGCMCEMLESPRITSGFVMLGAFHVLNL